MTADWRRALDIYVAGRNRALTVDEKRNAVANDSSTADAFDHSGSTLNGPSPLGISVPRTLEYFRNAGTWRDRIERIRHSKAGPGA